MSINEHFLIKGFRKLISEGHLSHAYLLFGESESLRNGIGESILKILEKNNENDFFLDSLVIEKKDNTSIGIDAIREAINFVWQKPIKSARRSIFIKNAEDLTSEAQNALLKTVEGPPPSGFVILSARSPEGLLKPLSSRLQKIYIAAPADISIEIDIKLAKSFISGDAKKRKEIIAKVLEKESPEELENFIKALLSECRKEPVKNFELMRRVTDRFYKISEYSTNKKLQLEALI